MQTASTVQHARDHYEARAWSDAYEELHAADVTGALDAEDLERLAVAANMTGRDAECDQIWERAHRAWLERGEPAKAARCAFWLSTHLNMRGENARAGGAGGGLRRGRAGAERHHLLRRHEERRKTEGCPRASLRRSAAIMGRMPTYAYRCRECPQVFELNRPMEESSAPALCPVGHTDTVKLLARVALTGRAAPSAAPPQSAGGGCCGGGGCG